MSRAVAVPRPAGGRYSTAIRAVSPGALLLGLVVLSRLLSFEEGGLAFLYLPHAWVQDVPGYLPPAGGFWFQTLLGPWAHWDGYWYLSIAHLGYDGRPLAAAFFPLYPLLLRLLGGSVLAGVLLSTIAFTAAMWFLYQLTIKELGEQAAWFTVIGLSFFPSAFYFNAVYPESLILFLSVISVYLTREGRFGWAALFAGIASAASIDGLLLAIPLGIAIWQQKPPRPWWTWSTIAVVPLGLLAFMAKLAATFGNPLTFQSVQSNWGRAFEPPWITVVRAVQGFWTNLSTALSFPGLFSTGQPVDVTSNVWNLIFAIVGVWLLVLAIRRLKPGLWLYTAAVLLIPFAYPSAGVPFMSSPRFLLAAWPLFMALGSFLANKPTALKPYLWTSGVLGAVLVALFATAHWVA